MIVVDSSALVAFVAGEPSGPTCRAILLAEPDIAISAATITEVSIVAMRRGFLEEMSQLIQTSITHIVDLTPARAQLAATAYAKWGKSFHPASLNFGDCFAYATAKEFNCPLLYVGDDFARTDVVSAITSPSA